LMDTDFELKHPSEKIEEIDYSEYTNKQLILVPAVILLLAFLVLGGMFALTGSPVNLGFDFTGGVSLQLSSDEPVSQVEEKFSEIENVREPDNVRSITTGAIVTFSGEAGEEGLPEEEISSIRDFRDAEYPDASIQVVSPAYGTSLLYQSMGAIAFAFLLMVFVIFVFFRTFVPSMGIVLSAFSDMVVPLAAMTAVGIEVSLGTIPAVLLLIGYSIDSDILLTRRTLSGRTKKFYSNVTSAMRTGVTMTTTSMAAMAVMAITAHFFGIFILRDIGFILFVGLLMDLINTYMMNIAILRWYVLRRLHG